VWQCPGAFWRGIARLPICLRLFRAEQVGGVGPVGPQGGQDLQQAGLGPAAADADQQQMDQGGRAEQRQRHPEQQREADRLTKVDQLGRPRTGRGRRAAGRRGPGRRVIRRARNVPTLEMPGSGYLGGQPSTASEPGLPNTHLAGQRGWISPIGPKPS
jgi:hypothetical protein